MIIPKRAFLLPVVIVLLLLIGACNPQQKEMEKRLAGEEFAGIVPCADCEGIAYRLQFYANSHYRSSSMYIGESNEIFEEKGSWRVDHDSTLVLQNREGTEKLFRLDNERLLMLDREGNEIQGSLASRYVLRNTRTQPIEGSLEAGESDSLVNFKAHGNEPFWGLEIDKDRMIAFRMLSGDSLRTPIREAETDTATGVESYRAETQRGSLQVTLHPIGCVDSMSGQVYSYRVEVQKEGSTFSGCGGYLNTPE